MATTPSSFTRLQTSLQATWLQSGSAVTTVTLSRSIPNRQPAPRASRLRVLSKEPEDARLTGGTRSLDRRLLALNLSGLPPKLGAVTQRKAATRRPAVA
jgi:hypothetical protein